MLYFALDSVKGSNGTPWPVVARDGCNMVLHTRNHIREGSPFGAGPIMIHIITSAGGFSVAMGPGLRCVWVVHAALLNGVDSPNALTV